MILEYTGNLNAPAQPARFMILRIRRRQQVTCPDARTAVFTAWPGKGAFYEGMQNPVIFV